MVPSLGRQARWRSRLLYPNQAGAVSVDSHCNLAVAFNLAAMAARTSSFVFPFGLSSSSSSSTEDEETNKSLSLRPATSLWWCWINGCCSRRLGDARLKSIFRVVFFCRSWTNGLVLGLGLRVGLCAATPHCVPKNLNLCSVAMDLETLLSSEVHYKRIQNLATQKTLSFWFFWSVFFSKVCALNWNFVDHKDTVSNGIPNSVIIDEILKKIVFIYSIPFAFSHVVCSFTFFLNVHRRKNHLLKNEIMWE